MHEVLKTLLIMAATATIAALWVMVFRLALKKMPRWITCLLWLAVFLRMVCPVGPSLPVSLIPAPVVQGLSVESFPQDITAPPAEATTPSQPTAQQAPVDPAPILLALWGVGTAGMLLWTGLSTRRLRQQVAEAIPLEDGIYETDQIPSPFLLGWFRPRIYLPTGMTEEEQHYVLLHERTHLRRKDHWAKLLAWLALSLHWWNPILHGAYRLFCRDLETACDQAVVRTFPPDDRMGYAKTLLQMGREHPQPLAIPLAFGEENTKHRVHHVLAFKHPPLVVVLIAFCVCILTLVLIIANPGAHGQQLDGVSITQAYVLDCGLPVTLPEDRFQSLMPLLKQVAQGPYTTAEPPVLQDGDIILSSQTGGTMFYLIGKPSPQLIRVNRDGNSTTTKVSSSSQALALSQDYARWQGTLNQYLTHELADTVSSLSTPYLGNNSACGAILDALHLSAVVGPYTFSLQTGTPPYGITIHLEQAPAPDDPLLTAYLQDVSTLFLALVDNAEQVSWMYAGSPIASFSVQGSGDLDETSFRDVYAQLRANAGAYRAAYPATS